MRHVKNTFRHTLLVATLILLIPVLAAAQDGHQMSFRVKGLRDATVLLGYYFGETTYRRDTAVVDTNGAFSFRGADPLPKGVYFIALNKARLFEFVVGNDQHFSLETDTTDYIRHMKVNGDIDNEVFFQNMIFNMDTHEKAKPFIAVLQDSSRSAAEKASARTAIDGINEKVAEYHLQLSAKHPKTVTSSIFSATRKVDIPEPPVKADGTIDSTFQLRWYRQHYFDHFDLSDDVLLRLPRPFYKEKVNDYLDKLFVPDADTVIRAIDFLVEKAKDNPETYKYLIYQCILKYQNPDIMGLDRVFVHLYDRYFATGEMDYWANEKFRQNIREHADRLRKSLVGNKGANLIMQDANRQPKSMYDIGAKYTILYFFDPDCGHCKTETPKLVDFYTRNKTRLNVEVYAVSADTSMQKMKDYIQDMKMKWITVNGPRTYVGPYQDLYDSQTTPTVYVLDERKKIIAKKIPVEKLEFFLQNWEQRSKSDGS